MQVALLNYTGLIPKYAEIRFFISIHKFLVDYSDIDLMYTPEINVLFYKIHVRNSYTYGSYTEV